MTSFLPQEEKPYLTIRPTAGFQAFDLQQIWQFRDLLFTLAGRDIKLRYRQTILGVLWVILQPLLAAGILSFVFNRIAKLPTDGIPPIVFSYVGLVGWNVFHNILTRSSAVLIGNTGLISKVYFPRLILPLSTLLPALLDFMVALGMLVVMMVIYRIAPTPNLLLLPIWLLLIILLSTGIGLFTCALTVSYRDVQYVLPVVLNLLLYASPVAYATSAVPAHMQQLYFLNPLAILFEGFRWSLLGTGWLLWDYIIYATVISIVIFIAGAYTFKSMERKFADVI